MNSDIYPGGTDTPLVVHDNNPALADARPRRGSGWRRFGGKFLVISIVAHVLFGAVAAYFVVQRYQASHKLAFHSGAKGATAPTRALEHKVQMKKQQTMSAPPQARRVTTTGLAKVALPDMPAMPSMTAAFNPAAISGMGSAGVGPGGFGGGPAGGMGGNGGAAINFFGVRTPGAGLVGTFYDLKQTPDRKPTGADLQMYSTVLEQFVKGGFNPGVLSRFYKAQLPIYTTQIWIPNIPATMGPAAFGVEKDVEPMYWCVHYKGRVTPPASFTFHFVGAGDDVMLVKFNGRLVLDRCWYVKTGWKPVANYDYGFSGINNGFAKGDAIQVEAGQSYPMEVMIGEQPGGGDFATLLQEIKGVEYEKDEKGNPILPVFRMSSAVPADSTPNKKYPPHRNDGPVWKGEPAESQPVRSIFSH